MGRLRGCIWLTAGLVVALLAGIVGYLALTRAAGQRAGGEAQLPQVQVVVTAKAVPVRALLTAADVTLKNVPVDVAPEGALQRAEDAVGKVTLVELYPGETVLMQRLIDPNVLAADGRTAVALSADQVLMAFPADDLMSRSGVLKPGDHVDLFFSLKFRVSQTGAKAPGTEGTATQTEQLATFDLLQNGVISAIVAGTPGGAAGSAGAQAPTAFLLTVSPQDALLLKYVKDAGGTLDAVLRAPGAERPLQVEPVDQDYVMRKYRVLSTGGQ